MFMKYYLIFFLFIFLCIKSFSQDISSEKEYIFRLGAKIGTNISKISKGPTYPWGLALDPTGIPGITVGTIIIFDINKKIAFQPEPTLNMVLFNHPAFDYQGIDLGGYHKREMLCISLPLLINYKIIDDMVTLQLGPQVNYTLSNKLKSGLYSNTSSLIFPEFTNKLGFFATGGVQFKFRSVLFSGRYEYGISKIDKNYLNNEFFKMNSLQFSIGFLLF